MFKVKLSRIDRRGIVVLAVFWIFTLVMITIRHAHTRKEVPGFHSTGVHSTVAAERLPWYTAVNGRIPVH